MKQNECGFWTAFSPCLSAAILGLLSPMTTLAAQKLTNPEITAAQAWELERARYKAELRREANWNGLTYKEIARVRTLLATRKARADREAALYEQFKFQQKLALAEASAPKTYVYLNGQPSSGDMSSSTQRFEKVPGVTYSRPQTYSSPPSRSSMIYPDRFYRRSASEEGLDRQDVRLDLQQSREDAEALLNAAPFGVPTPGRPGYMSSPPQNFKGYIDVRDYPPGTTVVDPYTGQRVRVP